MAAILDDAGRVHPVDIVPSAAVLGDHAAAFDTDLAGKLSSHSTGGAFTETVSFAYELARKPA